MRAIEWHTFQASELEEVAVCAYDAGDFKNWQRMLRLAAFRWSIVDLLDEDAEASAAALQAINAADLEQRIGFAA